ncbi:hypothetical protein SAMN04488021_10334 [Paracoccus aminovorans]|uniref:Uncharacterized protein n=1 Tax=Paracoccus aminovorans TaxID=34004 RepID=A0A1I2Y7K3_9RHOB|nr:hypothetical protein [Paracoccus aminovorans]CQR86073.1 hypothetical protein JCM7685_1502 [Paracoccus aminovorans]SFH20361.1 hypothetical protein SAMN04488021_10334 [Paracoccus aminovorans]
MRLIHKLLALILTFAATPALADAPLFLLDQTRLPFDLGPGAPQNQPARPSNSPYAAANSAASPANSGTSFANSPRNTQNEKRVIFTADGSAVGYYAPNGAGTLNLFTLTGKRVAYRPRGSKSLFSSDGRWCGTVADASGGGFAFGIIRACAGLF